MLHQQLDELLGYSRSNYDQEQHELQENVSHGPQDEPQDEPHEPQERHDDHEGGEVNMHELQDFSLQVF